MRLDKTVSVEELQVVSRFEGLRKILLAETYADHVDKPLAFWAMPTDRRLPLAFLGRTLRDLLSMPFVELSATPGIGRKKMAALRAVARPRRQNRPGRTPHRDSRSALEIATDGHRRPNRRQRRFRSDEHFRGDLGTVAGERRPPRIDRRDPRPLRPQFAEHDAGDLEHAAGRLHQFHTGRNPRHADARRETHPRRAGSVSCRPHHRGRHGHPRTSRRAHHSAPDRPGRAMDRPRLAAAGHSQPARKSSTISSVRSWSKSAPMPRSRSPPWPRIGWASAARSPACGTWHGPWG